MLIQSDSMDGHVDPVSCQLLMQVDEFDEDRNVEGRDEVSRQQHQAGANTMAFYKQQHQPQDQSPPAPRGLAPSEAVQRPQPHRLQLFPMPSQSYSYEEE